MSYYESAEDCRITKARAMKELRDHGTSDEDVSRFLAEKGDCPTYEAQQVLRWLGY